MRAQSLYESMTGNQANPTTYDKPKDGGFIELGTVIGVDFGGKIRVQLNGGVITCQQVTDDPAQYKEGVGVYVTRTPSGYIIHGVTR